LATLSEILQRVSGTAFFAHAPAINASSVGLFGNTPLHVAATWGDCEAISALVRAGADINKRGEHGFTPLMEAVAQGHQHAVLLLVSLGALPLTNDDGFLPSQYASISGNAELSALLTQRGC
jgi:ankyrin repeat protein